MGESIGAAHQPEEAPQKVSPEAGVTNLRARWRTQRPSATFLLAGRVASQRAEDKVLPSWGLQKLRTFKVALHALHKNA